MSTYTNEFLREWLPDGGDEYLYLNGRLFIGVTRFPYGDEVISQWSSNRDLRNTCNASMCIPFYTNAEVLNVNGRWVADGCLTQDTNDIPGEWLAYLSSPLRTHIRAPFVHTRAWQAATLSR